MRFVVRKLGLIIWAATVFAILIVPTWRLRASRQWESPVLNFNRIYSPQENKFGLFSALELEAARRFPDDPVAQMASLHGVNLSVIPLASAQNSYNDPRVRRAQNDYFARYDQLEERFPRANIVRAQHLLDVTRGWLDINQGPQPKPKIANQGKLIERERTWSQAQLQNAVGTAREGARIEPKNAFFPWIEAIVNFSLRRDDAAIAALRRAGQCNYFDDYVISRVDARLKLLSRLRAVGWEDEFAEWLGALLPHLGQMRTAARATMGRARLARQKGDEARALELAGIVQRAGAVVERTNGIAITKSVGQAICLEAWKAVLENQANLPVLARGGGASTDERTRIIEEYNNRIARLCADYCRARKRPDLAREALNIASKFDAERLFDVYRKPGVKDVNVAVEELSRAFWLGGTALIFGAGASGLWLLTWPLSRRQEEARARRQSLLCSMFLAGITVVLFVATLKFVPRDFFNLWDASESYNTLNTLWLVNPDSLKLLALLWVVPIAIEVLFHLSKIVIATRFWRIEASGKTNWFAIARALVATGFVLGLCGVLASLGQTVDFIYSYIFPICGIIFLMCALVGSAMMIIWSKALKRVLAGLVVGTFWTGFVALIFSDTSGDHLFYRWIAASLALILLLCAFAIYLRIGDFSPPEQLKEFAFQFAARTRIAAGVLALLCAVAYFGITLWTIPVEAQTRAMMQRQLQIGEVAWLREQIGARK